MAVAGQILQLERNLQSQSPHLEVISIYTESVLWPWVVARMKNARTPMVLSGRDTNHDTDPHRGPNQREHELTVPDGAKTPSSQSQHVSGIAETKNDAHIEDGDGHDSKPVRDTQSRNVTDEGKIARDQNFACPFFRRSPLEHRLKPSCFGRGWRNVSRVKGHLYRCHHVIYCRRCGNTFDTDTSLAEHQRQVIPCLRKGFAIPDGIDSSQVAQLRSHTRAKPRQTEVDKWRICYRICFPDDDESEMPSPYNEDFSKATASHEFSVQSAYERFLRHELPAHVRQELALEIEKDLRPIEESLRSGLLEIVAEVHRRLRSRFLEEATGATQTLNAFPSTISAYEESAGAFLGRVDGYALGSGFDSSKVDETGIGLYDPDPMTGLGSSPSQWRSQRAFDTADVEYEFKRESTEDCKSESAFPPRNMKSGIDLTPSGVKSADTCASFGIKLENTIAPLDIPCDSSSNDGSCSSHETALIDDDDGCNEGAGTSHGQDPQATLVDRLMIVFTSRYYVGLEQFLSTQAAIRLRPDAGSSYLGSSAQGTGSSASHAGRSGDHSSQTSIGSENSRKRIRESDGGTGDDHDDDDDDKDNRKRKRGRLPSADTGDMAQRKLACPFFKRRPATYMSRRSCPGPGWHSVHRLKDHLYSSHLLFVCHRCGEPLASEVLLREHLRAVDPCPIRNYIMADGIDPIKKELLRSRKKADCRATDSTEHGKWIGVYKILFPDDDPSDIPSPYYDIALDQQRARNSVPIVDFLRYDLNAHVRQEIAHQVEEDLELSEEDLRPRLGQIVDAVIERVIDRAPRAPNREASTLPLDDSEGIVTRTGVALAADALISSDRLELNVARVDAALATDLSTSGNETEQHMFAHDFDLSQQPTWDLHPPEASISFGLPGGTGPAIAWFEQERESFRGMIADIFPATWDATQ